jgi:biotin carboxyl carrier protein
MMTMIFKKAVQMALLLALCLAVAHPALAAEVMHEDFERFEGTTPGNQAAGIQGAGFTRSGSGWLIRQPLLVDYTVDLAGSSRGAISFDLMRKPGDFEDDRTVFSILDGDGWPLFEMEIAWESLYDPNTAMVHFRGQEFFRSGIGMWSPWQPLQGPFKARQWVHFDIVWDDLAGSYLFLVDGKRVNPAGLIFNHQSGLVVPDSRVVDNTRALTEGRVPYYRQGAFGALLADAETLRLGIRTIPTNPDVGTSALENAVLDNFTIYIGSLELVRSVTHDAFSIAGYSGKLVAGDMVTVTMAAEPGGSASFDLGDTITGIPMTESAANPGNYEGTYTVKAGDLVDNGNVTGNLVGSLGLPAAPVKADRAIDIDGTTHLAVNTNNDLLPANEASRAGITVMATDANGDEVKDLQLYLTLSTTDEYTGTAGGGSFDENVGGEIDVDWGGVTDSFGEVTAQYVSGFAAKTILVSAKDMTSGNVGVGYVRSYIDGTVDVVVKPASASALSLAGSMEVTLSRDWLTADGKSRSRITAVAKDADGQPVSGHRVTFSLYGDNGSVRVVQAKTDKKGRAIADYIAGTVMGQVQIEVRDMTSGLSQTVSIELRPDAPAEIVLAAEPGEIIVGGSTDIMALVTDVNGNPNNNVDVLYDIVSGSGIMGADTVATDEDGQAVVTFTGSEPGVAKIKGTVMSRVPSDEEISAAEGALFLYGLDEDPGELEVIEWLAEPGDEITRGQDLVILEDRDDNQYTVKAPRDGILSVFMAEEKDHVEYGDTLAYVLEIAE